MAMIATMAANKLNVATIASAATAHCATNESENGQSRLCVCVCIKTALKLENCGNFLMVCVLLYGWVDTSTRRTHTFNSSLDGIFHHHGSVLNTAHDEKYYWLFA